MRLDAASDRVPCPQTDELMITSDVLFLCKAEPGKVTPSADLVTFTFTTGASVCRICRSQHRILREHFAINLGERLAAFVLLLVRV